MTPEDFNRWLAEMVSGARARNIKEAGALIGRKPDMMTKYRRDGANKTVAMACAAALAGLPPYGDCAARLRGESASIKPLRS